MLLLLLLSTVSDIFSDQDFAVSAATTAAAVAAAVPVSAAAIAAVANATSAILAAVASASRTAAITQSILFLSFVSGLKASFKVPFCSTF